jgi:hypothetical protein
VGIIRTRGVAVLAVLDAMLWPVQILDCVARMTICVDRLLSRVSHVSVFAT